jgi:hypothetical protein
MKQSYTLQAPTPVILILLTGLVVGTVDGLAAIVWHLSTGGNNPAGIFKFIASCLIGKTALTGGTEMVILGVLLHFLIATIFSAFFYFLCLKIKSFKGENILYGALYGIFVWIVMNLILLPVIIQSVPKNPKNIIIGLFIHIICVGIPMSLIYKKFANK